MCLSFSVPESFLPDQSVAPDAEGDVKMEATEEQEQEHKPRAMFVQSRDARQRGSIGWFRIGSAGHAE